MNAREKQRVTDTVIIPYLQEVDNRKFNSIGGVIKQCFDGTPIDKERTSFIYDRVIKNLFNQSINQNES